MAEERDDLSTLVHGLKTTVSPFRAFLNELHRACKPLQEGTVSDTLPELAKADPNWFGICVVNTDGQIFEAGDVNQPFTLQAIARPFVFGLTLEEHGRDEVLKRLSIEPTLDGFDTIFFGKEKELLHNPMLNAGAIVNASLIPGTTPTARLNRILSMFHRYVGHEIHVDASTFVSTRISGHRYRALAHLLLSVGALDEPVDQTLDLFFQQHALLVTCRDLATMAAALANKGINPVTKERALKEEHITDILSLMYTSGMHEFTGGWSYRVGLPARSGVSGGIIAVVPQQIGIAVFSPPLNEQWHSVRGIKVCEELSREFGLHIFDPQFGGPKLRDAITERPKPKGGDAKSRISRALE